MISGCGADCSWKRKVSEPYKPEGNKGSNDYVIIIIIILNKRRAGGGLKYRPDLRSARLI